MERLLHGEVLNFLIMISIMLIVARVLGEIVKKFNQPAVIGELLAGILIGPSVLGTFYPEAFNLLFFSNPRSYIAYDGMAQVGIIFLLFVAGMEVDLPMIWKQGKSALAISLSGIFFPFALGFGAAWYFFDVLSDQDSSRQLVFSLFMGVALSISALPVIAKILIDLNLIKSKVGGLIMASAMVDDILGWVLFSVILGMMDSDPDATQSVKSIAYAIGFTFIFMALVLTFVRIIINKVLPIFYKYISGSAGVITFAISMCFLGAVFTEYIGIHAIFGAFLMGIAFGDSEHFTEKSREILHLFITNIFAPLFFASIGLRVNFIENFNLIIILLVLVLSYIAKVVGVGLGAYWSGLNKNESLAISFGMNARGSMGIILGLLALEASVIDNKMFVALVVMAIVTSITSGPLMKIFLKSG